MKTVSRSPAEYSPFLSFTLIAPRQTKRIALAKIHLALEDEYCVVGIVVNVLREFGARLRYGQVQRGLLCAQARMNDAPRGNVAHAEGFAFREAHYADALCGRMGCKR